MAGSSDFVIAVARHSEQRHVGPDLQRRSLALVGNRCGDHLLAAVQLQPVLSLEHAIQRSVWQDRIARGRGREDCGICTSSMSDGDAVGQTQALDPIDGGPLPET